MDEDLKEFLIDCGIVQETIKLLEKNGFTSLNAFDTLEPGDVDTLEIKPLAQSKLLKQALAQQAKTKLAENPPHAKIDSAGGMIEEEGNAMTNELTEFLQKNDITRENINALKLYGCTSLSLLKTMRSKDFKATQIPPLQCRLLQDALDDLNEKDKLKKYHLEKDDEEKNEDEEQEMDVETKGFLKKHKISKKNIQILEKAGFVSLSMLKSMLPDDVNQLQIHQIAQKRALDQALENLQLTLKGNVEEESDESDEDLIEDDFLQFLKECNINEDNINKLKANGVISFITFKGLLPDDYKKIKIKPAAQVNILRNAVKDIHKMPSIEKKAIRKELTYDDEDDAMDSELTEFLRERGINQKTANILASGGINSMAALEFLEPADLKDLNIQQLAQRKGLANVLTSLNGQLELKTGNAVNDLEASQELFETKHVKSLNDMQSNNTDVNQLQSIFKKSVIEGSKLRDGTGGPPHIYVLQTRERVVSKVGNISKVEYGLDNYEHPKVIMVVGATGAGKSTLINGMVNYIFGMEWEDDQRLKLIEEKLSDDQSQSQTQEIVSYTIYKNPQMKIPFNLTIIDTPGFGDTRGYSRDEAITGQIRDFFNAKGDDGIDQIDAVAFVTQSSLPRLTPTQKYIFDSILSLFGKNIEDNIMMLLTFADAQEPQVLSGIQKMGFKYNRYFKFNNSALFAKKDGEGAGNEMFNTMFWKMGASSYEAFFTALEKCQPQSLLLTKEVLSKRQQLESSLVKMNQDIKLGLNKLEQLKVEMAVVQQHETEIKANKNFTYKVEQDFIEKVDTPVGRHTTTCRTCNRTCHESCSYADDKDKEKCMMITDGYCRVCPGKCYWKDHSNLPFIFKVERQTIVKTYDDLKKRYQMGMKSKVTKMEVIGHLKKDFENHQQNALVLTDLMRQMIHRLSEIALKPNPMSHLEYIDVLIQTERTEMKPGHDKRIVELMDLRKKSKMISDLQKNGHDPFKDYEQILQDLEKMEAEEIETTTGTGENRVVALFGTVKQYIKNKFSSDKETQKGTIQKDTN